MKLMDQLAATMRDNERNESNGISPQQSAADILGVEVEEYERFEASVTKAFMVLSIVTGPSTAMMAVTHTLTTLGYKLREAQELERE